MLYLQIIYDYTYVTGSSGAAYVTGLVPSCIANPTPAQNVAALPTPLAIIRSAVEATATASLAIMLSGMSSSLQPSLLP